MRKQKGAAIITVLIVLAVISVLGIAFLEAGAGDYIFASIHKNNTGAYFLAQAGIEYAAGESPDWEEFPHEETISLSTGTCHIKADIAEGGLIQVESTGTPIDSNKNKTIYAAIKDGEILNWKQK